MRRFRLFDKWTTKIKRQRKRWRDAKERERRFKIYKLNQKE